MKLPGEDSTRAVNRGKVRGDLYVYILDTDSEFSPVGIAMLSIARAGLLVSLQICDQLNVQGGLTDPGVV